MPRGRVAGGSTMPKRPSWGLWAATTAPRARTTASARARLVKTVMIEMMVTMRIMVLMLILMMMMVVVMMMLAVVAMMMMFFLPAEGLLLQPLARAKLTCAFPQPQTSVGEAHGKRQASNPKLGTQLGTKLGCRAFGPGRSEHEVRDVLQF